MSPPGATPPGAPSYQSSGIFWHRGGAARVAERLGKALVLGGMMVSILVSPHAGTGALMSYAGMFVMLASYAFWLFELPEEGSLSIVGDVLVVERGSATVRIPIRRIASAYVTHFWELGAVRPRVEIRTRFGTTITARMHVEPAARELVERLGFGPSGKVVTIDLAQKTRRLLNPLIGFFSLVVGWILAIVAWSAFFDDIAQRHQAYSAYSVFTTWTIALLYFVLKRVFAAPVVAVGHDGVTLQRLFRRTHVPRAKLAKVAVGGGGGIDGPVVIERNDGHNIGVSGVLLDAARVHAIADVAAQRFGDSNLPQRATAFERGGRALAEWRAQIKSALDPGYRASGATVDDAEAVLASPSASVDQRIGAALALRIAGEPKEKIRIAAEGATDPHVRVALEAIAEDEDDEHIDKALRRIGDR